MTEPLYTTIHPSAIGRLLLVAGSRGLRSLTLVEDGETPTQFYPSSSELPAFFTSTTHAIDAYLAGSGELNLPVHFAGGTPLQRAVWLAIAKTPYGETISYTALADQVGFPRAVRAVASACGANPVPLAVPCHRVVAKDGTLGGFSLGGLEVKAFLLELEQGRMRAAA